MFKLTQAEQKYITNQGYAKHGVQEIRICQTDKAFENLERAFTVANQLSETNNNLSVILTDDKDEETCRFMNGSFLAV